MGVPRSSNDAARSLQLIRARISGEAIDAEEAQFIVNADANYHHEDRSRALEWIGVAEKFLTKTETKLELLNTYLQSKSVFVGKGTRITIADLGLYVAIRESVAAIPVEEQGKLPNLFRWFDYVQNKNDVREVYGQIFVKKSNFNPPNLSILDPNKPSKPLADDRNTTETSAAEKVVQPSPTPAADGAAAVSSSNKEKPANKGKPAKEAKEKAPAQKKEVDCDVSVLNICVGQIKKVWKHPSADSLCVEEIDVGEAEPRQIVSGLVKYVPANEMLNRRVLVLLNVKAGKVRDVLSSGLVLCASNVDHTQCEPVAPPDGVPIGERVKFAGHDGKAEDVLNPKKKQWERIAPELRTDEQGIANYQGVPFQTSGGPCKSSIVNGSIK